MKQINKTLYALNKDSSYQQWKVFVENNKVIVEFGKLGGKLQTKETLCKGKNIGRSNETTDEQQAILEAESKWNKQFRLGYRESMDESDFSEQLSPMLAHDAIKRSKSIIYPCYVEPKLDGLRCLVTFDAQGEPVFNSRGNKTYHIKGKIVDQIKELHEETGFNMFDGEIYIHGLSLQKIVSLTKKWRTHEDIEREINKDYLNDYKRWKKAIESGDKTWKNFNKESLTVEEKAVKDENRYGGYCSDDLEFHIFDIPSDKPWFIENEQISWSDECGNRLGDLEKVDHIIAEDYLNSLKSVLGGICSSEEEVKNSIASYMSQGYEGSIIRNYKGKYEFGQRSTDLQKWKIFKEIEAFVQDCIIDKNDEGVLKCKLQNGKEFECKMRGTHSERCYENQLKIVGKFITVRFQDYTDAGIPQFPVGIVVRELDPETWEPLE